MASVGNQYAGDPALQAFELEVRDYSLLSSHQTNILPDTVLYRATQSGLKEEHERSTAIWNNNLLDGDHDAALSVSNSGDVIRSNPLQHKVSSDVYITEDGRMFRVVFESFGLETGHGMDFDLAPGARPDGSTFGVNASDPQVLAVYELTDDDRVRAVARRESDLRNLTETGMEFDGLVFNSVRCFLPGTPHLGWSVRRDASDRGA